MIRTLNQVFLTRLQGALEYAGFVQLVVQVSVYLHKKRRANSRASGQGAPEGMMMSQMVLNTLQQVRDIAKRRGENIEIFTGNEKITKV